MNDNFYISKLNMLKTITENELKKCNEFTVNFGLRLNDTQVKNIVEKRYRTLKDTGRIEFKTGILRDLIFEFCDSPYISQDDYELTVMELLDSFYYFKNETMDLVSDEELLKYMKKNFDKYEGSIDYLNGMSLEQLCTDIKN